MKIMVSPLLPKAPTLQEDIVRMVRHGLADILEALGEDPGPEPGQPVHAIYLGETDTMLVSREAYDGYQDLLAANMWSHA